MINKLIRLYLKFKYGKRITIGKSVLISRLPSIVIGSSGHISIANDTVIKSNCDFRAYDNSSIVIGAGCKIDDGVRIIAANGQNVILGNNVKLGFYSVLNGGGGIKIGRDSSTYGFVYIQSSSHSVSESNTFDKQGYKHLAITIEENCLIQPHCCIMPGSVIKAKSIIPAHTVIEC